MAPKPQPIRLKTLEERQVEALERIAAALEELAKPDSQIASTLDSIDSRLFYISDGLAGLNNIIINATDRIVGMM
jgi:hypothetical protein